MNNGEGVLDRSIPDLENHIGETVTIFTTSGGESGRGFTGVIIRVNARFVRLVTRIGPAPGCALGNSCDDFDDHHREHDRDCDFDNDRDRRRLFDGGFRDNNRRRDDRIHDRRNDDFIRSIGSIVDIPIDRIAAVVFNSI